jgi:hypothetical protein
MSGKNDVNLDDNIFTFKPKVSSASAKIVENLGTDFMALLGRTNPGQMCS